MVTRLSYAVTVKSHNSMRKHGPFSFPGKAVSSALRASSGCEGRNGVAALTLTANKLPQATWEEN